VLDLSWLFVYWHEQLVAFLTAFVSQHERRPQWQQFAFEGPPSLAGEENRL
jgi:hypothetical protein